MSGKEVAMKLLMAVTVALLMALAPLHACTDADDPEVGTKQQDERIEVNGCRPGAHEIDVGADWVCINDYQPWWGPRPGDIGYERNPDPGGGRVGGGGGGHAMDPEPDRKKDFKSCWDWCAWNRRQCEKECWHEFPEPFGDWYKRSVCIQKRCEDHENPNIGRKACEADCQKRWHDRPIPAAETAYDGR